MLDPAQKDKTLKAISQALCGDVSEHHPYGSLAPGIATEGAAAGQSEWPPPAARASVLAPNDRCAARDPVQDHDALRHRWTVHVVTWPVRACCSVRGLVQ